MRIRVSVVLLASVVIGPPALRRGQRRNRTEEYQTKDPIDFVQAWYKKHLGPDFRLETGEEKAVDAKGSVNLDDSDVAFVDDRTTVRA